MIGTFSFYKISFCEKSFTTDTVQSLVLSLIQIAIGIDPLPHFYHSRPMSDLIGCSNELRIRYVE